MSRSSSDASEQRVSKFARAILKQRLKLVLAKLRAAAKKGIGDSEAVHQVRVSARKGRAAVQLFAPLLKPKHAQWFNKKLRKVRKAADAARNLDVCLARWEATGVKVSPAVQKRCDAQRLQAQRPITALDKQLRKDKLWSRKLTKALDALTEPSRTRETLADFTPGALAPALKAFQSAMDSQQTTAAALHQLRVAGKHLRYVMELLQPALPQRASETLLTELTRLQDELGAINDHATASELLTQLADNTKQAATKNWLHTQRRSERNIFSQARSKFLHGWTTKRKAQFRKWCAAISSETATKNTPSKARKKTPQRPSPAKSEH